MIAKLISSLSSHSPGKTTNYHTPSYRPENAIAIFNSTDSGDDSRNIFRRRDRASVIRRAATLSAVRVIKSRRHVCIARLRYSKYTLHTRLVASRRLIDTASFDISKAHCSTRTLSTRVAIGGFPQLSSHRRRRHA